MNRKRWKTKVSAKTCYGVSKWVHVYTSVIKCIIQPNDKDQSIPQSQSYEVLEHRQHEQQDSEAAPCT